MSNTTPAPTEAPLPCPFCGGKAQHRCEGMGDHFAYADRVCYTCTGCGVQVSAMGDASKGGYADNSTVEARALAAWNRRAQPAASPAPVVAREPLTDECLRQAATDHCIPAKQTRSFIIGAHFAEAAHGITSKEGDTKC